MIRLPPRSTRTDTLLPYTTLFRSHVALGLDGAEEAGVGALPVDDAVARPQRLLDAPADVEGIVRALRVDLHGVDRPGQPEEELGRLQRHVAEALVVARHAELEKAGDEAGLHSPPGAPPRGGAGRPQQHQEETRVS